MIKQTLLAILFFTCSIAFSQDLNITNNLPASANAGDAIDAQFTLTKGATMGSFAKFQLDLPAGFQAQSIDIKVVILPLKTTASKLFGFPFRAMQASLFHLN